MHVSQRAENGIGMRFSALHPLAHSTPSRVSRSHLGSPSSTACIAVRDPRDYTRICSSRSAPGCRDLRQRNHSKCSSLFHPSIHGSHPAPHKLYASQPLCFSTLMAHLLDIYTFPTAFQRRQWSTKGIFQQSHLFGRLVPLGLASQ